MKSLIFLALLAIAYTEAKPASFYQNQLTTTINECHGLACPPGTVACSKGTKTSDDKKMLLTTIQCEDYNGNVLNSVTKSTENPFEDTQISSFSFTGQYNYNKGTSGHYVQPVRRPVNTYDNNYYNKYNTNMDDQVETFAL